MARPGGLTPGPGPATGQHANIVTVGRERERERRGEQLQSVSRRPREETPSVGVECDRLTDQKLLKAG